MDKRSKQNTCIVGLCVLINLLGFWPIGNIIAGISDRLANEAEETGSVIEIKDYVVEEL